MNIEELKQKYQVDSAPAVSAIERKWQKAVAKARAEGQKKGGVSKETAAVLSSIYKEVCALDDDVSKLREKIAYENIFKGIGVTQLGQLGY